ncbi:ABC transporter C family member 5 [Nymphaea thermarum]|nr:ABC transporter C family member 5 [Nymphaea thermarum]
MVLHGINCTSPVLEDGENWRVDQRQLVSLAKARLVVLDEATAAFVDMTTDNFIQKIIQAEFNDSLF